MASFSKEFYKLILVEGGYVNDPDDSGGETFLGISRKHNPNWKGWEIIDKEKKSGVCTRKLKKRLKENLYLIDYAKQLYKSLYWDCFELDDIPNQDIAHQMFDTCVNCGKKTAINIAQHICGMTANGKWSDELKYNLMQYGKGK